MDSIYIVWTLFKGAEVNFNYLPWRTGGGGGRSEKLTKGGGSMVQGQKFLKGGGQQFSYLILPRFIIFTFKNYFTLCKTVLCI